MRRPDVFRRAGGVCRDRIGRGREIRPQKQEDRRGAHHARGRAQENRETARGDGAKVFPAEKLSDIDRVLPRMVALEYILETARYPSVRVVERELGVGLIIEAGSK